MPEDAECLMHLLALDPAGIERWITHAKKRLAGFGEAFH